MVRSLTIVLTLNTLFLSFEREFLQHGKREILKGCIYYQAPSKAYIQVYEPLKQIVVIADNVMTIYYPMEKTAFRIRSKSPIPPPFIQALVGAMKEDYGLEELGFEVTAQETRGDTLYTHWKPPKKQKKLIGKFVLGKMGDKLVYAGLQTPDGKSSAKSFFQNHVSFEGKYLPLETYSQTSDQSGITEEHVTYSNLQFNVTIPDSILNFQTPHSIPVKEIEW